MDESVAFLFRSKEAVDSIVAALRAMVCRLFLLMTKNAAIVDAPYLPIGEVTFAVSTCSDKHEEFFFLFVLIWSCILHCGNEPTKPITTCLNTEYCSTRDLGSWYVHASVPDKHLSLACASEKKKDEDAAAMLFFRPNTPVFILF